MTAVYTLVQSTATPGSGTGSVVVTLPAADTAGNNLIACIVGASQTAFAAPNGNWRLANRYNAGGTATGHVEVWYLEGKHNAGGDTSFTFTGPAGIPMRGGMDEYSLPASYSLCYDSTGVAAGVGAGSTVMALASAGGNSADCLGIAAFVDYFSAGNTGSTWNTITGYTPSFGQAGNVTQAFRMYHNTDIASGIQTMSGGYSTATGSTGWAAVLCCFRARVFIPDGLCGAERTNSVAVDPTGQYVICGGDVEGMWRSADNGDHWQLTQANLYTGGQNDTACVQWSLLEANTIYACLGRLAGLEAGFGASTDGGITWTQRSTIQYHAGNPNTPPLPATEGGGTDRSIGNNLLAQDSVNNLPNGHIYTAAYTSFQRSNNLGTSWTDLSSAFPSAANLFPRAVVCNPANPKQVWVATWSVGSGASKVSGVYEIADATVAAGSMTPVQLTGYTGTVSDLLVLGGFVYAACNTGGLYRCPVGLTALVSLNGAGTAAFKGSGLTGLQVDGSCKYNGLDGYVDGSGNHQIILSVGDVPTKGTGNTYFPGVVQVTLPGGTTTGMTWTDLTNNPAAGSAIDVADILPLYQGAYERQYWASGLAYHNWLGGASYDGGGRPTVNPVDHKQIWVTGQGGVYRTDDGGVTWNFAVNGMTMMDYHNLCWDPVNANHLVISSSDHAELDINGDFTGYTASDVSELNPSGANEESHAVAIDPVDANVYLGMNNKYSSNSGGAVFIRPGNTPTTAASVEIGFTAAAAAGGSTPACVGVYAGRDGSNNRFVLALAQGAGMYRGTCPATANPLVAANWTWTKPAGTATAIAGGGTQGQVNHFASKTLSSATIYVFDKRSGVYRSTNYGTVDAGTSTWTLIYPVTVNDNQSGDIAVNPNATGEVWITTTASPHGLVKLTGANAGVIGGTGGGTATTLTNIALVGSIDFFNGQPYVVTAPSGTTPAGLFTSSNGGGAWTNIAGPEFAEYMQAPGLSTAISATGQIVIGTSSNNMVVGTLSGATAALAIVPASGALPPGQVGVPYPGSMGATGGTPPYTFALASGALPGGVTLNADGSFSGSPTGTGTFTFTIKVTDSATPTPATVTSGSLTITVTAALLNITTTSCPNGALTVAYSFQVLTTGGTAPITFALAGGSGPLPTGLSISSSGLISGTPTVAGTYSFVVQATDSTTPTAETDQQPLTIVIPGSTLQITTTSLPGAVVGGTYAPPSGFQMSAAGGQTPYTWGVIILSGGGATSSNLPAGLGISSGGLISGTPTAAGAVSDIVIQVTDNTGATASAPFTLNVTTAGTLQGLGIGGLALPGAIGTLQGGPTITRDLIWEVFVYDYATGFSTLLAQIPRFMNLQFSKMVNDKGSGQVTLNLDDPAFWNQTLPNGQAAEYLLDFENLWQIRRNGIPVFEFLGETITEQLADPSEQRNVNVTGPGTIQVLTWARAMPPGFPEVIFKTDAITDSFDEVDQNGNPTLDTALWNLSTPLSGISLVPAGAIGSTAQGENPNAPQFFLGTCYLTPNSNTVLLGAGTYDITSSVISAQMLPMAGPGLNGSQESIMSVVDVNNPNHFAQIQVTAAGIGAQVGFDRSSTSKLFGPYSANSHAYWQITDQNNIFYFWTSADGQSWARRWSVPHSWNANEVNVFFAASYAGSGPQMGVSAINQDVITPSVAGSLYYNMPIMAIWLDQLRKAQKRGTIPFATTRMTAQGDSTGNGWTDINSVQIANGTDLYALLQGHCAMVDADFIMEPGFVLRVGLPSSQPGQDGLGIGRDRSTGQQMVLLRESTSQVTKQRTRARDQIANLIGSINSDNTIVTAEDTASMANWLQREGWVETGATVTEGANQIAAEASVSQTSDQVLSWTLTVDPAGTYLAFKDYFPGDWVCVEPPGVPGSFPSGVLAVRIVAIAVQIDQTGLQTVELTVESYRQWLAEQLSYLASKFGGDFVSTNGTTQITNQTNNPVGLPSVVSPSLGGLGDVIVSP